MILAQYEHKGSIFRALGVTENHAHRALHCALKAYMHANGLKRTWLDASRVELFALEPGAGYLGGVRLSAPVPEQAPSWREVQRARKLLREHIDA